MSASASLVMGWRLSELIEVRKVEGPKKFSQDTGKPVSNPVDRLFVLGKEVPDPDEIHPNEWADLIADMDIYSVGDGSDNPHGDGLRSYDLTKFVAGVRVAHVEADHDCNGANTKVEDFDHTKYRSEALAKFAEVCESLGIKEVVAGKLLPALYLICYQSY